MKVRCISNDKKNQYSDPSFDHMLKEYLEVGKIYNAIKIFTGDYIILEFGIEFTWEKENFEEVSPDEIIKED